MQRRRKKSPSVIIIYKLLLLLILRDFRVYILENLLFNGSTLRWTVKPRVLKYFDKVTGDEEKISNVYWKYKKSKNIADLIKYNTIHC